jgi:hypothetical protein
MIDGQAARNTVAVGATINSKRASADSRDVNMLALGMSLFNSRRDNVKVWVDPPRLRGEVSSYDGNALCALMLNA